MKTTFRILHCLRAPVGGLFRHVCDLAATQSRLGHGVAVVCADAGDALTDARLHALHAQLQLGVHRVAMERRVGLADVQAARQVHKLARALDVDVIHGHGAKGGAYARLAGWMLSRRTTGRPHVFYTPHGGSLHYAPSSLKGRVFMGLERRLERATDGLIFESRYSSERFREQVGPPRCATRIIANGVTEGEFDTVTPDADATDVLYIGELRFLKGVDVLLRALALVNAKRPVTATIVGSGPDADAFRTLAGDLGLSHAVRFVGARPAREAFKMGRLLVIPSRAESFPYIVLEAGAARVPMIATHVGGIPEIVGDSGTVLVRADEVEPLTVALFEGIDDPASLHRHADALSERIRANFTVGNMTDTIVGFYQTVTRLDEPVRTGARRLSIER